MLEKNPLHINQHAYQPAKLTETGQKAAVITIGKAPQTKEIALRTFLDIKVAFDSTSIEAISSALLKHGLPPLFERWIASMLSSRFLYLALWGDLAGRKCQGLSTRSRFITPAVEHDRGQTAMGSERGLVLLNWIC